HRGRAPDLAIELGEREPARRAVLALPSQRLRVGARTGPWLRGRDGMVERAAAPPAREFGAVAIVEHRAEAALPAKAEVVDGGPPEPTRIRDGARLERVEALGAGRPDEPRQAALGRELGRRTPRRLGVGSGERGRGRNGGIGRGHRPDDRSRGRQPVPWSPAATPLIVSWTIRRTRSRSGSWDPIARRRASRRTWTSDSESTYGLRSPIE